MSEQNKGGMAGFDSEFTDLDQYIRVITDRIWEGGRLGDIERYYSDPCVVETPSSVSTALSSVIDGTRATLVQFPDRRLLAEDIIVSGDDEGGYLSSHRIISTMTHLGAGNFGSPTGNRIHVRTIADCVCKDNRIIHEWLVRDQGAIARQIGLAPSELAQRWLDAAGGWVKPVAGPAPAGYHSHLSKESQAQRYAQALQELAFGRASVALTYDDAVHQLGPGGQVCYGQDEVQQFWGALFGALKVESFEVEHLAFQQGDGRADRVALRWRARAVHSGGTMFGTPSGKPLEILGINHVEFFRGRVLREWVLLDEIALWMQVLAR
ncbi:ester cyclase [Undibacterium sp. Ji22W]|uniref:nuclear transport factor 2 family protein n=1 Tax=Undibacterium sp. Ji22W TaxID=3413038 RepID=UPI003BF30223